MKSLYSLPMHIGTDDLALLMKLLPFGKLENYKYMRKVTQNEIFKQGDLTDIEVSTGT